MNLKRLLAVLLALALMLSALPTVASAAAEDTKEDVWDVISVYEDAQLALRHPGTYRRGEYKATEADFAALSRDVETIVTASASYQEGTIERHGEFLFWQTTDGEPNGYSPRLRARIRENAIADADPEELSGIETVSYARGGSAGSVNVASFQPYYGIDGSFTTQYADECKRIAQALGGIGTNYKTSAATVDAVANALETCGVVIFDSHGDTDYASGEDYVTRANTSYLCMQTNAGWTSADQQEVTGPYGTYYHCFNGGGYGSMKYYMVDGTVFANHMTGTGCNNLLWMAICLGMATDGLWKPLQAKGVEVIYGYSQSVSFSGDYAYEEYFFDNLIAGGTAGEAFAYMKQKCNRDWDPAYSASSLAQARYKYIAFPNIVSSEDAYQGHRTKNPSSSNDSSANNNNDPNYGACNIQTPVSSWTLYTQFTVTAVSNNDAWGTVSVNGKKITATPKTGYYVKDAEVISGTATLTQDGNVFTVNPETDCTVRVNFAAKTPATISFVTPDGVSCESVNTYVGDSFTMPVPSGNPTADAHEYRFIGWAQSTLNDTTERPSYLTAGKSLTATGDAVYYALYVYTVAAVGETGFAQVVDDPGSWEGEYVLSYNSEVVLDASGKYTGSQLGSKEAAVTMANAGMGVSNGMIADPNDDFVYVIEPSAVKAGAWTIRMKNSEHYIAYTGNTNSVTTASDPTAKNAQWYLSFVGGLVSLQNANTVGTTQVRYLQYNTTSKQFRCYMNTQKNLTLFTGEAGTRYYTTALTSAAAHEHACALAEGTAPTCTASGIKAHLYCAGCGKCFSLETFNETGALVEIAPADLILPALGHNMVAIEVVAANCTNYGYTAYGCTRCETYYLDDFVDALGHNWSEPVYVWAEDNSTVDASHKCSRCEMVEAEQVETVPSVTVAPTVETEGVLTYTATFTNPAFTTQTKTEAIPKLDPQDPCADGHDWGEPDYVWAEDYSTCTATRVCKNNPEHIESETARADGVETKPATEEEEGEMIYTAEFENEAFGIREITVAIPKLEPVPQPVEFDDVSADAYYAEPVAWAVENGVTNGTGDGRFSPDKNCTRAQVVTFLWRAEGSPEPTLTEHSFTDLDSSKYYYKAVLWAVENGITSGVNATTFAPDADCNRGQVVTFLWRAEDEPQPQSLETEFTDVETNAFYYKAMCWAVENGITKGVSATSFGPKKPCTRGQIVTFLYRAVAE